MAQAASAAVPELPSRRERRVREMHEQILVREIAGGLPNAFRELLAGARAAGGTTSQQIERFFALVANDAGVKGEQNRALHDAFGSLLRDGVRAGDVTTAYP